MRLSVLASVILLTASSAHAAISFKKGWNDLENSDVRTYTQDEVTEILRAQSEDLRLIIDGPSACMLEVTKGCHDKRAGKSHFTINGAKSTDKCKVKSIYVGSKSDHEPSCQ